ncbi:hypothetical protein [Carnobacterium pleistocenium]|uniref:hypothetical protein n=1 Tax=Carnobacterium pleistocenium TaxID=181073 RepID=UPI000690B071|nr:hypothetical protein [Carnobacterium pleistocenium]
MNRAEKRRQDRLIVKQTKTYTFTQAQIDKIKEDATMAATKRAFAIMLAMPMMVLRDQFGFGKKRLSLFTDKVFDIYEAYEDERLSLVDMHETIELETGVVIKEVNE